jgi:NAD(P)-dependent dehydrogenase (short-subunit alcohol dehydrogenase family)
MDKIAFVTGADRGLGLALCAGLLDHGWRVYAGQYMPEWPELGDMAEGQPERLRLVPLDVASLESTQQAAEIVRAGADRLDLLVNNAGVNSPSSDLRIRGGLDYDEVARLYQVNAAGPLRVVESFLPLMRTSTFKRLCFISSEAGSIGRCYRDSGYAYCMSKAALNMGVRILFNDLQSEGYSFRLYHPGWVRSYIDGEKNMEADIEPEEAAAKALPIFLADRADEDRLVMVDFEGVEGPW